VAKIAILFLTLALAGSAWAHGGFGRPGDPKKATRNVRIGMADTMRYSPAELTVRRGETVKFIVRNHGKLKHEMVIGTMGELKQHAEMMKKHPGMEHEEAHMVDVEPGKTGILVWHFTKAGIFHFGCLEPGHFEAGMIGKVEVVN
jgi:uncharacterized cupredoxin-like copper-binding protein